MKTYITRSEVKEGENHLVGGYTATVKVERHVDMSWSRPNHDLYWERVTVAVLNPAGVLLRERAFLWLVSSVDAWDIWASDEINEIIQEASEQDERQHWAERDVDTVESDTVVLYR